MKKIAVTCLSVVLSLLLGALPSSAQAGITFGTGYEYLPASTLSLPAEMRTVPTNPADGGVRNRTIPDSPLRIPSGGMLSFSVAPQVRIGPLVLRGGFQLLTATEVRNPGVGDDGLIEWGQFANNANRGTGTSLVYVSVAHSRLTYGPFFEAEIGHPVAGAIIGYRNLHYGLIYENGWDRYDRLEVAKSVTGGVETGDKYFGLTFSPFGPEFRGLAIRGVVGFRNNNVYRLETAEVTEVLESDKYFNIGIFYRFGRK
ncbi:MAG: hypothetical protein ACM3NH_03115 [Candidatus Saccharibacteria bacterium]